MTDRRTSTTAVRRQRRKLVALGAIVAVGAAVLLYVGYTAPNGIPGRSYYTITAEFERGDNLADHYQVRSGGRLIGQVLRPRVRDGRAVVDLQLDGDVGPLRSDTTLRVRPRSAIGVRFVDLTPGKHGRPLPDGGRIPVRNTSAALPIDDALGILDRRRRLKLQTLLTRLGMGVAGRGMELNVALGAGKGFLDGLDGALRPLNARPGATEGLVSGLETLVSAADPVREEIASGLEPEARALRPLAEHADGLRDTLHEAPPTLDAVRTRLPATEALLAQATGLAREATPALRLAPAALGQTNALLSEARPSLRTADRTLGLADEAIDPTLALLRTAHPVLPHADGTLKASLPTVDELAPRGCDVADFFEHWDATTRMGNTGGNFLRLNIVRPSSELLQGLEGKNRVGIGTNAYPKPCEAGREKAP